MKGVSTRFLTMDALEADSQAVKVSRQTGQGREARTLNHMYRSQSYVFRCLK